MIRHFSAQTLALYREDGLTGRKASRVRAHLAGCELCAGRSSDLAEVSAVLAQVEAPAMPEHLADRIMLVLASESAARAGESSARAGGTAADGAGAASSPSAASSPAHIPGRPDLPERTRRKGRSWLPGLSAPLALRTLAATAAVALIAGGGYLFATSGGSSVESAGGGTAARPGPSAAGVPKGTAGVERAPSYSPVNYHRAGTKATTIAVKDNTDFTPRSLAGQVRRVVRSHGVNASIAASPAVPTATKSPGGTSTPEPRVQQSKFAPQLSVPHLGGCLTTLSAGRKVLLADIARYLGKPAMIVVLQSPADAGFFEVSVVGLACSASSPHVIFHTKIPVG